MIVAQAPKFRERRDDLTQTPCCVKSRSESTKRHRCKTSSRKSSDKKHEREKGVKPKNSRRNSSEKRMKKSLHALSNLNAVNVQPQLLKKCQKSLKRVEMTWRKSFSELKELARNSSDALERLIKLKYSIATLGRWCRKIWALMMRIANLRSCNHSQRKFLMRMQTRHWSP